MGFSIYFIFAFIVHSPTQIVDGLYKIYTTPDVLISDYIHIGGIGAALINSALVGMLGTFLLIFFKCPPTGLNIMPIWLMSGFAFFGKNLLNILPIILGGYLYSKFQKQHFSENLAKTLMATTLSPIVSQMSHVGIPSRPLGIIVGILLGMLIGFIIIPVAGQTIKATKGYNLYNVGFAGGLIAIILSAILRNGGIEIETLALWSSGNNMILALFLLCLSLYLFIGGCFVSHFNAKEYFNPRLFVAEDIREHDFYQSIGEQSYQNMGTVGIAAATFVLLAGAELNGPAIGGIFTIIGFGCRGKNILNMAPVVIGGCLASAINAWQLSSPNVMLSLLFSTTLSPIASRFGIHWGLIAGFLHLNIVSRLGELHGGLNLYNNGLAGGLVATMLVPIILALKEGMQKKRQI